MPRLPWLKKPNIPLPDSLQISRNDLKEIVAYRDTRRLSRHLSWLLADFKSLPRFVQVEACKALNRFVRKKRPLPPIVAELPAFELSDRPLNWGELEPGDILFVRPNPAIVHGFLWAMHYSHCGIYAKPGYVMEANVDQGVRLQTLERWQASRGHMGFARLKPEFRQNLPALDEVMARAIEEWCDQGVKYNLAMWKEAGTTHGKSYCSELIWMIYEDIGVELRDDPPSEVYTDWIKATFGEWAARAIAEPAIAPDELALSSKLEFFSVGKTR